MVMMLNNNNLPTILGGPGGPKVPQDLPATPSEDLPKILGDALKLGAKPFEQMSREDKQVAVKDAFDHLDHAESVIHARMMQAYVGWNPATDKGYQAALKEQTQAKGDIERYRKTEPDMVALEAHKHTAAGEAESTLGKIGSWLKKFFTSSPTILPGAKPWQM